MPNKICLDASVIIPILTSEALSHQADTLWQAWINEDVLIIVPPICPYEVCSVLRQKTQLRKDLSPEQEQKALDLFLSLDIEICSPSNLLKTASDLAIQLGTPTIYDTTYLALAQLENCGFWTADHRFYNVVTSKFDFVKWLGDVQLPTEHQNTESNEPSESQ
jgi:predicted nucleic acid-binding protein